MASANTGPCEPTVTVTRSVGHGVLSSPPPIHRPLRSRMPAIGPSLSAAGPPTWIPANPFSSRTESGATVTRRSVVATGLPETSRYWLVPPFGTDAKNATEFFLAPAASAGTHWYAAGLSSGPISLRSLRPKTFDSTGKNTSSCCHAWFRWSFSGKIATAGSPPTAVDPIQVNTTDNRFRRDMLGASRLSPKQIAKSETNTSSGTRIHCDGTDRCRHHQRAQFFRDGGSKTACTRSRQNASQGAHRNRPTNASRRGDDSLPQPRLDEQADIPRTSVESPWGQTRTNCPYVPRLAAPPAYRPTRAMSRNPSPAVVDQDKMS